MIEPKNYVKNGSHTLGPTHYVGSSISGYLRSVDRISDEKQRTGKEVALMPTTLSTTVRYIYDSAEFCEFAVTSRLSTVHERQ
jgi:hypothetical protein